MKLSIAFLCSFLHVIQLRHVSLQHVVTTGMTTDYTDLLLWEEGNSSLHCFK